MTTPASDTAESAQPRGKAFVQAVMQATLTHLADVGFERFSIPQVAQLAGVNKTSIYRRWPGKAELVRDALHGVLPPADQVPDTGTLRGDLVALVQTVAAFMQSRMGTVIIRIMLAEGGNAEMRALAQTAYSEIGSQGPWVVLRRAVERGELAQEVDPSLVLFTLAGAVMHRVFVERQQASGDWIVQVVQLALLGATPRN